jgi:hypothetical protein
MPSRRSARLATMPPAPIPRRQLGRRGDGEGGRGGPSVKAKDQEPAMDAPISPPADSRRRFWNSST